MYSFFALSGSDGARLAAAVTGSLIITAVLLASIVVPSSPATASLTAGVLA
ncbi:MAG: hypothetical protein ACX930_07610 [Erythrobacter sp.]